MKIYGALFYFFLLASCSNTPIIGPKVDKKNLISDFNISGETAEKFSETPIIVESPKKTIHRSSLDQSIPVPPKKLKEDRKKQSSIVGENKKVERSKRPKMKANKNKEKRKLKYSLPKRYPDNIPPILKEFDRRALPVWNSYQMNVYQNEFNTFAIKYFGVNCGTIEIKSLGLVKINNKKAFHFYGRALSAEFYEYFYKVDDYVEAFVNVDDFSPIKYTLVQRESGQSVDDLQIYDVEKLTTSFWYKKVKEEQIRKIEEVKFIPRYVIDSFSALYFIRGLDLSLGKKYEIPIVTRAETWLLAITVEEEEDLSIGDHEVESVKIRAETHFPGVLKKRGDIFFWFSKDEIQRPLKFEGKVKIGSVEGILVDYVPGEKMEPEDIEKL